MNQILIYIIHYIINVFKKIIFKKGKKMILKVKTITDNNNYNG